MATLLRSIEGVFLDITLSQPGILPRSWWLSLARNLPLYFLDSTFGGKIPGHRKNNPFPGSENEFPLSTMRFSRTKKKRFKKCPEIRLAFFYSVATKLGAGVQIYFTTKKCKLCYSDLWVLLEGFSWVSSARNQRSKDNNFYVICHAFLRTAQCASFVHAALTTGSRRIPNSASNGQNCPDFISNTLYIIHITNIVVLYTFVLKRMYKNTYTMVCHTAKTKCRKF
jgi:hypothetical protein